MKRCMSISRSALLKARCLIIGRTCISAANPQLWNNFGAINFKTAPQEHMSKRERHPGTEQESGAWMRASPAAAAGDAASEDGLQA